MAPLNGKRPYVLAALLIMKYHIANHCLLSIGL
jgi:hypothetical protein